MNCRLCLPGSDLNDFGREAAPQTRAFPGRSLGTSILVMAFTEKCRKKVYLLFTSNLKLLSLPLSTVAIKPEPIWFSYVFPMKFLETVCFFASTFL